MKKTLSRHAARADVALLLEGTYPYISGGVSSWVAGLLEAFPEYTFAIVFIGGRAVDYGEPKYEFPDNVVDYREVFLFDQADHTPPVEAAVCPHEVMADVRTMHDRFVSNGADSAHDLAKVLPYVFPGGDVTEQLFLHGQQSWDEIRDRYERFCTDPSFTDYFWTVRIMHIPLWKLFKVAHDMIPVSVCHAVSTGYAGFLGTLLNLRKGVPLFISEHGIYTKERQIDLFQSEWVHDNRTLIERSSTQTAYFQELWIRFFKTLGKQAYDSAGAISALFEGNHKRQLLDGAPLEKTLLIPNGIVVERFRPARERRKDAIPMVAALIGRVVPIKDVKTFVRSIFIARRYRPDLQGWIVGPMAEDPAYVQECQDLVAGLGLQDAVQFLGFRDVRDVYPDVGVVVLSSISEGLPLVILEAYAAGVPVVATDVGACRELIEGRDPADRALGTSGRVVRIADPAALAAATLELLGDANAWRQAQTAGIARVEQYYTHARMVDNLRAVYQRLISGAEHNAAEEGAASWPA